MKPAIPTSISSRLASMEKAIREMHQQGDSYDELGHELIRHAKRTHSIAHGFSANVWAIRDALKLMAAGAEPDWCNFRVSGISYDADPGVRTTTGPIASGAPLERRLAEIGPYTGPLVLARPCVRCGEFMVSTTDGLCLYCIKPLDYDRDPGAVHHESIADRPQVVRPYEPDGKPAVDPRIVPGCWVRVVENIHKMRQPDSSLIAPGTTLIVAGIDGESATFTFTKSNGDYSQATPLSDLEFVSPPPAATFAPDMTSGTFPAASSDRVHGSPFAAADSTPNVTSCMDVFDDGRLDPRIVPGCTVKFRRDYSSRVNNGPESTRVWYRTGDEATVRKAEAFSAWIGGVMVIADDVEFVAPPAVEDEDGDPASPASSTISFADQAAAAMQAERLMGEDTPTVERLIARYGDPVTPALNGYGYPRLNAEGRRS